MTPGFSSSEEHLQAILDTALDAVITMDDRGIITTWNSRAEGVFGWLSADAVGRTVAETIVPPASRATHLAGIAHFLETGEGPILGRRIEITALHRDGREFPVELTVTPLRIGARWTFCAFCRDITARREAEEELVRGRQQLARAQQLAHLGSWEWDLATNTVTWSEELYRIYGIADGEFAGTFEAYLERVHPDDRAAARAAIETALSRGAPFRFDERIIRPDGEERILESEGEPVLDARGKVRGLFGVCHDMTERRRDERMEAATLRIAEAASIAPDLDALLSAIHVTIGELMDTSNFYVALHDEVTGMLSFPYFVDEVDPTPAPKRLGRGLTEYVLRTGLPQLVPPERHRELERAGEVELIGAPSIDWLGVPLRVGDRTIGALVSQTYTERARFGEREQHILQFVSTQVAGAIQRKRAEEQLRESETRYRLIFERNPEAMFVYDVTTLRFADVNDAAVRRYGYTRDEFLDLTIKDLRVPGDAQLDSQLRELGSPGPHVFTDVIHRTKDGSEINVEITVDLILRGDRPARLVLARDVTERRRMEGRLQQSQRMEAVGQLAGGVAHDFNNLLTAVSGYSDLLLQDMAADDPRRHDVEEIRKASESAGALTQQLLAFSRKQLLQPRIINLNDVVAKALKLLRRLIGENIELHTRLDPKLGAVQADPAQLEQVIVNLVVNARDAMPDGGKLVIETINCAAPDVPADVPAGASGYVCLSVRDTGGGMDDVTKARLFEPFFTTKEMGKGTGLGLATVYGIVQQSGGTISVSSDPAKGTVFHIWLPVVDAPPERLGTTQAGKMPRGTETILLVEDEPAIRVVVRRTLERQGYTVLEAPEGKTALALAQRHSGTIDLLVTDVVMPGLSGRDLANQLVATRPETRVLFISGYSEDAIAHRGVLDQGIAYLAKPFGPDMLARKVREVLDGRPATSA